MNDLVLKSEQQVAKRDEPTVLDVIERLAVDARVSVEKLAGLMQLQERAEARQAEREFTRDFALASADMPRVAKNGVIDMGAKGSMKFARYEDLDAAIRPVELKYGFTRNFLTEPSTNGITMVCKLSHRGGHSERSARFMPPDASISNRSAMQAIGSASHYAKRYLTLDVWNIVTVGADDDGTATGWITDTQADSIMSLLEECGAKTNPQIQAGFLKYMEAKTVSEIRKSDFAKAIKVLEAKRRKGGE